MSHFPWLDTTEYPFQARYYAVNEHHLHYIDEGEGSPILFVHGTPSWSFDFRQIIKQLRSDHRCIAIDHIGFGLSDKPEHYDYSTQTHSLTLEKFILDKRLDNLTLVVHDFGGPIGLQVALRHPTLFRNIIVLNSWMWNSETDPNFIKFSKVLRNPLLPLLYKYFNFSPRFVLPQSFGEHRLPPKLLRQYTAPFANSRQRNGTIAFAKSLLNDQKWFGSLWEQRHILADKAFLFLWGMKDPVIKPHYLAKFQTAFPTAQTLELPTAGHFPQEEQADRITIAIKKFLNGQTVV